jgi:hypothetical protein
MACIAMSQIAPAMPRSSMRSPNWTTEIWPTTQVRFRAITESAPSKRRRTPLRRSRATTPRTRVLPRRAFRWIQRFQHGVRATAVPLLPLCLLARFKPSCEKAGYAFSFLLSAMSAPSKQADLKGARALTLIDRLWAVVGVDLRRSCRSSDIVAPPNQTKPAREEQGWGVLFEGHHTLKGSVEASPQRPCNMCVRPDARWRRRVTRGSSRREPETRRGACGPLFSGPAQSLCRALP